MILEHFCPECLDYTNCIPIRVEESFIVKDEDITIEANYLRCLECEKNIPDFKLDEENFQKVYAEFRKRKNLLQPNEIKDIRIKYGLSQRKFARLIGWSHATLSRYETGALQSISHNNELVLLQEPKNLLKIIERNSGNFSEKEIHVVKNKVEKLVKQEEESKSNIFTMLEKRFVLKPSKFTGFKEFNFNKFVQLVKFYASRDPRLSKVKLMKYLWYSDFLSFKRTTLSISGLKYVHLPMGPVPENYEDLLYLLTMEKEHIEKDYVDLGCENFGELYKSVGDFDESLFEKEEVDTLIDVYKALCDYTSTSISDLSHKETAWREISNGDIISYEYAINLSLS